MRVRLIKSAHGLLFFVAVVYADVASRFTAFDDYGYWVVPFIFILLMAVVSMLASLVDEYVHKSLWGLHLFTVYYGAIVGLFGLLTIAHDYL